MPKATLQNTHRDSYIWIQEKKTIDDAYRPRRRSAVSQAISGVAPVFFFAQALQCNYVIKAGESGGSGGGGGVDMWWMSEWFLVWMRRTQAGWEKKGSKWKGGSNDGAGVVGGGGGRGGGLPY